MSHYLVITGGVGGAKLAIGLSTILPASDVTFAVNTGDDFDHLGFHISPDIDTLTYTLAGLNDTDRGWGRRDESWNFLSTLRTLDEETWFQLGDRDLAIHVYRTLLLTQGKTLSEVTDVIAKKLGIKHFLTPMTDQSLRTVVVTADGKLPFQDYFVKYQAKPIVEAIEFSGSELARLSSGVSEALASAELSGVIICPSNPYLSIDPILSIPGFRSLLSEIAVPVIAVSPIIGGKAIKGPTEKIMNEMDLEAGCSSLSVARHYQDILDGIIIDTLDAEQSEDIAALGLEVSVGETLMTSLKIKQDLAQHCLSLIEKINTEVLGDTDKLTI
ncbi:2-phospho-L-lactate transferase [Gammaproteobacteria bacterium]|nr:2-phospho-L-lactate transferase [Gammaproteobacteria bacterium]